MTKDEFDNALNQKLDPPDLSKCHCCNSHIEPYISSMFSGMCRKCFMNMDQILEEKGEPE